MEPGDWIVQEARLMRMKISRQQGGDSHFIAIFDAVRGQRARRC